MDEATRLLVRQLLLTRPTAALATLHEGRPAASMVPFAVAASSGEVRIVTHVSRLAGHTRDMLECPEVCLLVTAAEEDTMPQALPRISIPAVAEFIPPEHPDHGDLKAAYLTKHPQATGLFQLGDFSIVAFTPLSARLVGGFAQAHSLRPEALAAALAADVA